MARIYPFRALRYNSSQVRLADVVTQPYDKISPALQQAYYQRSPYNLVRIILGLPELFDQPGDAASDIYARAAGDFASWRRNGILAQENEPSIFAYAQRFAVPSTAGDGEPETLVERRGLIALGHLHDYADGVVFRHEQTLAKPKSDRLNLLRTTRAHFGQLFMLYSDPANTIESLIFTDGAAPEMEVTDDYGVLHRVWRISDPAVIRLVTAEMADRKLIIADGHHRYETALAYAREHAPETMATPHESSPTALPAPPWPEAAAMMTFVNMDSDGLVILPTHRVVHSLAHFDAAVFFDQAKHAFELKQLDTNDTSALLAQLGADRADTTSFLAITTGGATLLTLKPEISSAALAALSPRQQQLDVVRLHTLVLEELLGLTPEDIRQQTHLRYLRDADEAMAQVRTGQADIAFLVRPITLEQLREVAFAGEVMPQKSTDFYPKLLSGLTIYALD
ncbi:DUF1015 domain-containing protein [Silvibacterium dinghuense]|uniref:DUF1015 domain-containing protein n=1 Tax=Silvibacterium dinghuense TaxID=1560006 RepID=A0A4Q1SHD5_9BACT|nr:DUF1015 domain-containing protein [Silvibacterium dinghuense]RXS96964.1 DUF1015 domain-containing protein [Silvibacterium dinghuense]